MEIATGSHFFEVLLLKWIEEDVDDKKKPWRILALIEIYIVIYDNRSKIRKHLINEIILRIENQYRK